MARPRRNNPALFTSGEIVAATGITVRNVQWLRDNKVGPFRLGSANVDPASGLYGENVLTEAAMMAGLYSGGLDLKLGGAITAAFLGNQNDHAPGRFSNLDAFLRDHSLPQYPRQLTSWFQIHELIRQRHSADYEKGSVWDDDQVIIVADRRYVLEGALVMPRLPRLVLPGVNELGPFAVGEITGFAKGESPEFSPIEHMIDVAAEGTIAEAEIEYQIAAQKAVGKVIANVSLAIRLAFDRVFDLRCAKGGPFFDLGEAA